MEGHERLAAEATGIAISEQDQREIHDLYSKLRAAEAKLVGPDGKVQVLPGTLYSFLCQLLADLKDGNSVTILQSDATLTTVEAAKLLGVSAVSSPGNWKRENSAPQGRDPSQALCAGCAGVQEQSGCGTEKAS